MARNQPEIFGDKQLDILFTKLKYSQKRSIIISAFRKASKPMLQKIKANLIARTRAKTSGNLAKSLGYKPVNRMPILHLGARRFGNFKGYHSHLIEAGTKERFYTTKTGKTKSTGRVKAKWFFKYGVKTTEKQTADRFRDAAVESFVKLIKRVNAKRKT